MILGLVDEACAAGARQGPACAILGLDSRTVQRWKAQSIGEDLRAGPKESPGNKLTEAERARVLEIANAPEHRDLSPKQIVPLLADQGIYVASEATFYRVLRAEDLVKHREPSRPPTARHRPTEYVATGPNQVWSWDITYLKSPVRGSFFYLYAATDVWSRKLVGWAVHDRESGELAREMISAACSAEGVRRDQLVLHSDNGGPMKGATLLTTLQALGVVPSFSRPRVSDDNPYSEALFRTMKYRPEFPRRAFASLEETRRWVAWFVRWYNHDHQHSTIRFVAPAVRHAGKDVEVLAKRRDVYEAARARHPERWSRGVRDWSPIQEVVLNPVPVQEASEAA
jgi:transposase InsO family protein